MSESKVFMFPENGNSMMSAIAPLLQRSGVDPNLAMAMMNRNGFGGDSWIWVIFLFFLMGWGNWGGNRNNESGLAMLNSDAGRELLMQGINGNNAAINQLATTLNCDINQVQQAINAVMASVQQVANTTGQSALQVINAIQQGNAQLASQVSNCCCENRLAIANQTSALQQSINSVATGQERGFSSVAYATQSQTCDLQNSIKDATSQILAGQRAAEMREMQEKIDTLRELNSQKDVIINNGQQTAIFGQMIQQATAPIAAGLNVLQTEVGALKCRLPETVTLPFSYATAVPTYGLFNNFAANTLWG